MKLIPWAIAAILPLVVLTWNAADSSLAQGNCDPSYPDVCIAPPPPDLDCSEITYRDFRVVGSDPHRFDGDKDGFGCES